MHELKGLEKQGQMMRTDTPDGASLWQKAVQFLSAEQMKFELNTVVDTLHHNPNLHVLKKECDYCSLCGERQILLHNLNVK